MLDYHEEGLRIQAPGQSIFQYWLHVRLELHLHYSFTYYLIQVNRVAQEDTLSPESEGEAARNMSRVIKRITEFLPTYNAGLLENVRRLRQINVERNDNTHPDDESFSLFDTKCLSLFFHARFIERVFLSRECYQEESVAPLLAITLCKVAGIQKPANRPWYSIYLDIKNLFLAGLVLTKSRHPQGITQ